MGVFEVVQTERYTFGISICSMHDDSARFECIHRLVDIASARTRSRAYTYVRYFVTSPREPTRNSFATSGRTFDEPPRASFLFFPLSSFFLHRIVFFDDLLSCKSFLNDYYHCESAHKEKTLNDYRSSSNPRRLVRDGTMCERTYVRLCEDNLRDAFRRIR